MNDFGYKLRKFKNKFKRKFQQTKEEEFAETTEYTSSFKVIMITLLGVIALSMVFIILLLTHVISFGSQGTSIDASTFTPEVVTVLVTPTPTEEPTAEPTPSPTPRPTIVPGPTPKVVNGGATPLPLTDEDVVVEVGWIDTDYLNVRTGPSENYRRIGVLPQNSVVEVLEMGRWLKIKFLDGAGYCTNTYYVSGYLPSDKYDALPTIPPDSDIAAARVVEADYSHVSQDLTIMIDKVEETDRQYFVAEIWCDASNIASLLASETLDRTVRYSTSEMFEMAQDAVLAINGDFISYHDYGTAIRNGEIYRDSTGYELLVLYSDGEMVGIMPNKVSAQRLIDEGAVQCWSYGPILVQNYVAYDDFTSRSTVNPNNPRTGIGMIEPGHYIVIVADGRREDYSGPTLVEFAKMFEDYGCKIAYNLEGGSASTLVFKGEVLNSPSGEDEKLIGDIIYFK